VKRRKCKNTTSRQNGVEEIPGCHMPKVTIKVCGLYNAVRTKEDVELNSAFSYTFSDSFKVALS
jgi:hypothetical protein